MTCTKCGYHNEAGAEFCASCGEYLAWDEEAGSRAGSATAPAPGPGPGSARSASTPPVVLEPRTVQVEPGGEAVVRVDVHNRGAVHTELTPEVSGLPAGWVTSDPPVMGLFPDDWGTLVIRFRPPMASSPPAGSTPFRVSLRSSADANAVLRADGLLELGSFLALAVDAAPTSAGRLSARNQVRVRNDGNSDIAAAVSGRDAKDALRFRARPESVSIPPGGHGEATLDIRPRRVNWFGAPRTHPFRVVVGADGAEGEAEAVMEQRRLMPPWAPIVLLVVVILLFLLR